MQWAWDSSRYHSEQGTRGLTWPVPSFFSFSGSALGALSTWNCWPSEAAERHCASMFPLMIFSNLYPNAYPGDRAVNDRQAAATRAESPPPMRYS